jgi:hypothetical protein
MYVESFFPSTSDRVARFTPKRTNERIIEKMESNISLYAQNPNRISERLLELDREWDIDRAIELWGAGAISVVTLLGFTRSRKFHGAAWAVGAFLLSHALFGWCPPTAVLRQLGFRSAHEIESEKISLRILRGDFA